VLPRPPQHTYTTKLYRGLCSVPSDAALLGEWILTFTTNLPSVSSWSTWPTKEKAIWSFETSERPHPTMQQSLQLHGCGNFQRALLPVTSPLP